MNNQKSTTFLMTLLLLAAGAAGGWLAARYWHAGGAAAPVATGRKILYYQSAMHPWIKSDKPGKCTICGMDLVPIYEGEKGFEVSGNLITLSSNSVTVLHAQTLPIQRQALRRSLRVAGLIEENDVRHKRLSAYVDGRIEKLAVNYLGAEVIEGQPLAVIYSPILLTAEREYVTLLARFGLGTNVSDPLAASQQSLLEPATERLRRMGLTPAQIAALPQKPASNSRSEILAPMTGTIVQRDFYEGQYVKEGDKLFELADFSTMWFRFDVYERDLGWIKPGQTLAVSTPALPGRTLTATISFIEPTLEDKTRSAKARAELPNPLLERDGKKYRELYARLYAAGVITIDTPAVLTLPRNAVLDTGSGPLVYIEKSSGTYEVRRVKLGRRGDESWEALEGVAEGERVVTTGNLLIDAQAQFNQSIEAAEATAPKTSTSPQHTHTGTNQSQLKPSGDMPRAPLSATQEAAAQALFTNADALADRLAADNLDGFNEAWPKFQGALPALKQAYAEAPQWRPLIQPLADLAAPAKAASLEAARTTFGPLSAAVVAFAQPIRRLAPAFQTLKVYQCPMSPPPGLWLQLHGPVRNPFFGAKMLDCGDEVSVPADGK